MACVGPPDPVQNFTNVSAVDDQGNIIAGTGNPAASPTAAAPADFGSCSVPQIEFGVGFDGRKETSFQPTDKRMSFFCVSRRY